MKRIMRRRSFLLFPLAVAGALGLGACKDKAAPAPAPGESAAATSSAASGAKPRIAVIPKGTTHEFWKAVHAGAAKAAQEANVEIVWKGPLKEDDLKSQVDLVESFVAQGVKGIVLAPLSDTALRNPVKAAKAAGIPVVIFDSDLQSDDKASFVATDNVAAGKMAGEELSRLVGKGNAVVLRCQVGSASTSNREQGALEAMHAHSDVKVVSDNQYGGATTESAFATSESLLAAQKASSGNVGGVFAPNESTTFGMLLALRKAGLNGKIKFVGFDASEKLLDALSAGDVDALVVQDPFRMGELGVKTMADVLAGKPVEKRVDTGAKLVTKASLADPAMQAFLKPDLKKWLGE
jgi:ribose transport system substrate-binding protein